MVIPQGPTEYVSPTGQPNQVDPRCAAVLARLDRALTAAVHREAPNLSLGTDGLFRVDPVGGFVAVAELDSGALLDVQMFPRGNGLRPLPDCFASPTPTCTVRTERDGTKVALNTRADGPYAYVEKPDGDCGAARRDRPRPIHDALSPLISC
jgi:hypothetical protein